MRLGCGAWQLNWSSERRLYLSQKIDTRCGRSFRFGLLISCLLGRQTDEARLNLLGDDGAVVVVVIVCRTGVFLLTTILCDN